MDRMIPADIAPDTAPDMAAAAAATVAGTAVAEGMGAADMDVEAGTERPMRAPQGIPRKRAESS